GVGHQARNGEWAHATHPSRVEHLILLLDRFDAADAAADHDAAAEPVFLLKIQPRVRNCAHGGGQGELGEAINALGLEPLAAAELGELIGIAHYVELRAFATEASGIGADIPADQRADPVLAGADLVPHLLNLLAQGSDQPQTRDDDATPGHGFIAAQ